MSEPIEHHYERIESIFTEACAFPEGADRDAFLLNACNGDEALRKRIEQLLMAHNATENLDMDPNQLLDLGDVAEKIGTRLGPYLLLEKIGEGGFGVVYMAEQKEPVHRRVALKIIKLGMDTKQVVARFEAERQALALMEHPGIAKVYDAGATETGRPYFVMELVRGTPINKYCDTHRLPLKDRLLLVAEVCRAVDHAHSKGILHRDLKPGNILVGTVDDKPSAKVIDFGIAKATESTLTDRTLFTRFCQLIGTPAYMSPEQAGQGPVNVDERTDVYSLGVLLYQLLVGATPLDSETLRQAGVDEIRRIIKEVEPPKPSTRLSSMDAVKLDQWAVNRGLDPKKNRQNMGSDLDWIVMKALEKDRTRRYRRASDLASDLACFLGDKPVVARPPSITYRAYKFCRRHQRGIKYAAMFFIFAVLATGIAWHFHGESNRLAQELSSKNQDMETVKGKLVTVEETKNTAVAKSWFQSASRLRDSGKLFESKLLAAKAIGFEGFGREQKDPEFQEQNPVLVPPGASLRSEIETFLRSGPDHPIIWQWFHSSRDEQKSIPMEQRRTKSALAYGPQGRFVASAWQDGILRLWDLKDGSLTKEQKIADESPGAIMFDLTDQTILSGWQDGKVRQWNPSTRNVTVWDDGHEHSVTAICVLNHTGGGYVTGDDKGHLIFRDAKGAKIGESIEALFYAVKTLATDAQHPLIAVGGYAGKDRGILKLFDPVSHELQKEWTKDWTGHVTDAIFRPWHDELAVAVGDRVDLLNLSTGDFVTRFEFETTQVHALDFSPDGRYLAVGMEGGVTLCDLADGSRFTLFTMKDTSSDSIAFGPDGKTLLGGTDRGGIRMWEVTDPRLAWDRKGHWGTVTQVQYLPNNLEVVSGAIDGYVDFWDLESGMLTRQMKIHDSFVTAFTFEPDGTWMATSGGRKKETLVWDMSSGEVTHRLGSTGNIVDHILYSPTSQLLALYDRAGNIRVFTSAGFESKSAFVAGEKRPANHSQYYSEMAFDASGRHLIIRSWDAIEVWDAENGQRINRIPQPLWDRFLFDPETSLILQIGEETHAYKYPSLIPTSTPQSIKNIDRSLVIPGPEGRGFIRFGLGNTIRIFSGLQHRDEIGISEPNNTLGPVKLSSDDRWLACGLTDGSLRVWSTDLLYDYNPDLGSRLEAFISSDEGYRLDFRIHIPLSPMAQDSLLRDLKNLSSSQEYERALFKRLLRAGNLSGAEALLDEDSVFSNDEDAKNLLETLRAQSFDRDLRPPTSGPRAIRATPMTPPEP